MLFMPNNNWNWYSAFYLVDTYHIFQINILLFVICKLNGTLQNKQDAGIMNSFHQVCMLVVAMAGIAAFVIDCCNGNNTVLKYCIKNSLFADA